MHIHMYYTYIYILNLVTHLMQVTEGHAGLEVEKGAASNPSTTANVSLASFVLPYTTTTSVLMVSFQTVERSAGASAQLPSRV